MIDRVRYEVRREKSPTRPPSRRDAINDALGAQRFEMRDDADRTALLKARVVWQRHQKERKQRWLDWTETLGPALVKVQTEAMAIASTNKTTGKRYAQAASGLLKSYHLDQIDRATRSHAINIMQNLKEVTNWLAKQEKPERLNHPTTVWRSFERTERGIKTKKRHSSPTLTRKQRELDSPRADFERIKDAAKSLEYKDEPKSFIAPASAREVDDYLGIPNFLNRSRSGALATLLASEKLTLQDVPTHTTVAALTNLAKRLGDLAAAMNDVGEGEANE